MRKILVVVAGGIFLSAIGWPALALIVSSIQQGQAPREGFGISRGQFVLLGRTVLLAFFAALLSLAPALWAGVWSRLHKLSPIAMAVLAAGLVCPPMVYSFGWLRLFPLFLPAEVRCVIGWTVWAWPVAAILVASGWARAGHQAFDAARLCTTQWNSLIHVGMPALAPYLLLALLLLFVLFLGDYGMPHGFGLRVFSTELLAWSSESSHLVDVLWPALLPAIVTAIALTAMFATLQRCKLIPLPEEPGPSFASARQFIPLVFMAAGWALPLFALSRPLTCAALANAWRTYWADLAATLGVAVVAAVLVGLMAIGRAIRRRERFSALLVIVMFGTLPGAVIGQAMIAAYNHSASQWLYDHWPIISLAYAARYAWIGALVLGWAATSKAGSTSEQARLDGATETQILRFITWPRQAPLVLAVAAIVVALSVGDVATTTPIRVPQYQPIAILIIDKFHQFQDGMLISLSLILVALALLSAGMMAYVWQIRTRAS